MEGEAKLSIFDGLEEPGQDEVLDLGNDIQINEPKEDDSRESSKAGEGTHTPGFLQKREITAKLPKAKDFGSQWANYFSEKDSPYVPTNFDW